MIAEVIINSNVKKLNRKFDYNIPEDWKDRVHVGTRVLVPFGNAKNLQEGFVISIKDSSNYTVKEIAKIDQGELTEKQVNLAILMANRYFCNISDCIKLMLPPGTTGRNTGSRIKEKTGQFVYLQKNWEEIESDIEEKIIKSPKQIRFLNILNGNEGIHILDIEAMSDTSRVITKSLEKNGYIQVIEKKIERNPFKFKNIKRDKKLTLTEEQMNAFNAVKKAIDEKRFEEFLLYGVTGSGKTEVYLQLIEQVINKEKTAIMLVPEISLTPQMVDRFLARFGDCISVLHSKLSIGERYDQWQKIKEGRAKIIIGARSAIFAPIKNIGLILIDEEHDSSYKSDMSPRYHAKDIARFLAKENNIPLILGSATPEITTFYKAKNGEITLLTLTKRANNSHLPSVNIVDLREELAVGNRSMISTALHKKIEENLKEKKQIILFLNRRGYSTFVMCRECGFTAKCKNCNITLTYHKDENKLKCHYCGFETKNITTCPICKSKNVRYFGGGTQKLETEINKLFPSATTIRMDIDTVTKKNSHEIILNKFKEEDIDILIGTQMIVKGHHFPRVTLVGVIAADSSLNIEDYRANERTFQILTQVAGRAGRENLPGEVIIQTYNPNNFSISYDKNQDYNSFYKAEISLREKLNYPPFCDIIVIGVSSKIEKNVKEVTQKLALILKRQNIKNCYISEPIPSPINKINNRYRWRIVMKCNFNSNIIDKINDMLQYYYNMKVKNTRIVIDVNPSNML